MFNKWLICYKLCLTSNYICLIMFNQTSNQRTWKTNLTWIILNHAKGRITSRPVGSEAGTWGCNQLKVRIQPEQKRIWILDQQSWCFGSKCGENMGYGRYGNFDLWVQPFEASEPWARPKRFWRNMADPHQALTVFASILSFLNIRKFGCRMSSYPR